uniref:Uncharacterized protein n=1 Tax=Glossina palpalis gambiensis TaxID=67801 RepID=A0A1B0B0M9_9MUSC
MLISRNQLRIASNGAELDVDHINNYFLGALNFSSDNVTYSPLHVLTATSFTPRLLTLNQSSAVLMEYQIGKKILYVPLWLFNVNITAFIIKGTCLSKTKLKNLKTKTFLQFELSMDISGYQ